MYDLFTASRLFIGSATPPTLRSEALIDTSPTFTFSPIVTNFEKFACPSAYIAASKSVEEFSHF